MNLSLARWAAALSLSVASLAPGLASAQPAAPLAALRTARNTPQRVSAIATVAVLRPEGARPAIERELAHPNALVRVAAVQALRSLRDPAAVPALTRRSRDPDRRVRLAVNDALGSFGPAPSGPAAATPPPPTDWRRVLCAVEIGVMDDRVAHSAANTDALREGLRTAVTRSTVVALDPGRLPPAAAARARTGALRVYDLNANLDAISPTSPPGTVSVHVEISILLLSEGGRSIIGTIGTAASASEPRLISPDAPDQTPRLTRAAIETAAHGAIAQIEAQCAQPGRRR